VVWRSAIRIHRACCLTDRGTRQGAGEVGVVLGLPAGDVVLVVSMLVGVVVVVLSWSSVSLRSSWFWSSMAPAPSS
jgi:hypothetical protein